MNLHLILLTKFHTLQVHIHVVNIDLKGRHNIGNCVKFRLKQAIVFCFNIHV